MESGRAVLTQAPELPANAVLFFASPVHAFHLAAPMKQYLAGLPDLAGRPFAVFATEQLPYPWLGWKTARCAP